jgi:hypothetical protein
MFKFLLNCECLKTERERINVTEAVIEEIESVNIKTIPEHRTVTLHKSHSVKSQKAEIIDINDVDDTF